MTVTSESESRIEPTCADNCASMHPNKPDACEVAVKAGRGRVITPDGGVACDACCAAVDEERIQKFNSWTI